jgi:predicted transcriptional regulator
MTPEDHELLTLTTEIVAAYAANTPLAAAELPRLIAIVHAGLRSAGAAKPEPAAPLVPAVPIRRSIGADFIVCLEDGRKMKMLRRYLATHHGLTPDAYRRRWGLPDDYPMIAPAYAAERSALAKTLGLGRKPVAAAAPPEAPAQAPARRVGGRRKRAS